MGVTHPLEDLLNERRSVAVGLFVAGTSGLESKSKNFQPGEGLRSSLRMCFRGGIYLVPPFSMRPSYNKKECIALKKNDTFVIDCLYDKEYQGCLRISQ
jgi:hypothetical protein